MIQLEEAEIHFFKSEINIPDDSSSELTEPYVLNRTGKSFKAATSNEIEQIKNIKNKKGLVKREDGISYCVDTKNKTI